MMDRTEVTLRTGTEEMHPREIVALLRQTVWAKDRTEEAIHQSLKTSLCYGAFDAQDHQIGFARVITDFATHYYICDVVVDGAWRHKGVGTQLLTLVTQTEAFSGLLGMLITEEAEKFYQPFGFHRNEICFMTKP